MKLHILSDLHLECAPFTPPPTDADLVILAGDIGQRGKGIDWAREQFSVPVLYVPGNHEFDHGDLADLADYRRRAAGSTVRVLDHEVAVHGGVRFLCTTLWADFEFYGLERKAAAITASLPVMTDYRLIRDQGAPFDPAAYERHHREDRDWLAGQLATPFDGPTVVITHHAPHRASVEPRYAGDLVTAAFVSHLDALLGQAVLWVHGHMHASFDYRVGGTRVLCNPRGYVTRRQPVENAAFDPGLVVEI